MLRLFTAIEIPQAIRMRLSLISAPIPGAKWIEPDNIHITLTFAGDIDGRTADEFAHQLANIRVPTFEMAIRGLGAFGGREPHAIWAGVIADGSLTDLQRANDRAARAAGIEPNTRAFKPHATIARLRGTRAGAVARFLEENGGFATEPFRVERFVLYSARPRTGGGPYVVEQAFRLDGD